MTIDRFVCALVRLESTTKMPLTPLPLILLSWSLTRTISVHQPPTAFIQMPSPTSDVAREHAGSDCRKSFCRHVNTLLHLSCVPYIHYRRLSITGVCASSRRKSNVDLVCCVAPETQRTLTYPGLPCLICNVALRRGHRDGEDKTVTTRGESTGGASTGVSNVKAAYFPLETVVVHERVGGERQRPASLVQNSDRGRDRVASGAGDCSSDSFKLAGSSVSQEGRMFGSRMPRRGMRRGRGRELGCVGGREGQIWGRGRGGGYGRSAALKEHISSARSYVAEEPHGYPLPDSFTPYVRDGWEKAEDGDEIGNDEESERQ
jgi:hypothetical protein